MFLCSEPCASVRLIISSYDFPRVISNVSTKEQKARRIQKVEKFVCGALSKDIVQGKKDRLRVLILSGANFLTETNRVDSKEPHDPSPNTVSFYKTQMEMDHTLLTNKQIGFTGLCYTQIETLKCKDRIYQLCIQYLISSLGFCLQREIWKFLGKIGISRAGPQMSMERKSRSKT
ncbi:hypothetical protein F5051DRAFT_248998 [Lentinula edodes]|nr:hypothetical protein F5051DRAFT_248998 [Lentinula edodes]